MAFGGVYKTGTITVSADATAVTGAGTLWAVAQIEAGDILFAAGSVGVINSVTDDTNLVLESAWGGGALSAAAYVILKTSWTRYDPALVQSKVRLLLATLQAQTIVYSVTGAAPDAGLGEDGQYALKANGTPWKLWLKVAGEWIEQSQPAGVAWKGAWSSATAYVASDIVSNAGKTYIALQPSTNKPPTSEPTYWDEFVVNGDVYDVGGFSPDKPGSGENILSWLMNRTVTFPAGLTASRAKCGTAATATAIFSIQKNGVEFGTITIAAGGTVGVIASASDAIFAAGDVLDVIGPSPRDATLADMHVTLFGYR